MSSTIQFGFDIDTGESVDNLDKLTGRMDGFIDKYVKAMDELGRGSKTIVNLTKALGGNVGQLSLAANEIAKIKTALSGDMSIRGLSRNITTQFKGMTAELKTMFGEIPKELSVALGHIPTEFKTINAQLTNILYQTENNLSKVAVAVQDIRDNFVDAAKVAETLSRVSRTVRNNTETKPTKQTSSTSKTASKTTTPTQEYLESLGLPVTGLTDLQNMLINASKRFSADVLRQSPLPELKSQLEELTDIKERAARISATPESKVANTLIADIKTEIALREERIATINAEIQAEQKKTLAERERAKWKSFKDDADQMDQGIRWATSVRDDVAEWDSLVAAEIQAKQRAAEYGQQVRKNIQEKKEQTIEAEKAAVAERHATETRTGVRKMSPDVYEEKLSSMRDSLQYIKMEMSRDWFDTSKAVAELQEVGTTLASVSEQSKLFGTGSKKELQEVKDAYMKLLAPIKEVIKQKQASASAAEKEADAAKAAAKQMAALAETQQFRQLFNTAAGVSFEDENTTLLYIEGMKRGIVDLRREIKAVQAQGGVLSKEQQVEFNRVLANTRQEYILLRKANVDMKGTAGRALLELATDLGLVNQEMKKIKDNNLANTFASYGRVLPERGDIKATLLDISSVVNSVNLEKLSLEELIPLYKRVATVRQQAQTIKETQDAAVAKDILHALKERITLLNEEDKLKKKSTATSAAAEATAQEQAKKLKLQQLINEETEKATILSMQYQDAQAKAAKAARHSAMGESVLDEDGYLKEGYNSVLNNLHAHNALQSSVTETVKKLKELASQAKNSGMLEARDDLLAYAESLEQARKEAINLMKGQSASGVGAGDNLQVLQSKEEIDLLKELRAVTERVTEAKKKLAGSKGTPVDANKAREELNAVEGLYAKLKDRVLNLNKSYATLQISGSQAMKNIKDRTNALDKEMGNLNRKIGSTENSYKNIFGKISVFMAKFSLTHHFFSVIGGAISGAVTGMFNFARSFAEAGSELINFEKQMKALYASNPAIAEREIDRLKQLADYYGVAMKDVSKYYMTITQQMKEMGATENFSNIFRENILAAVRGQGLDMGGVEGVFRAVQQMLSKNKPTMEEITTQLTEHLPTFYLEMSKYLANVEKDGKRVYKEFEAIKGSVDLKEMVSKNKVSWNDFIKGVTASLGAIGQKAENVRDSYEANVSRLSNAWTSLQKELMEGAAGMYLSTALSDITNMVKDPTFRNALMDMVGQITRVAQIFINLSSKIIPALLDTIANSPLIKLAGVDLHKEIANSDPALKQSYLHSVWNVSDKQVKGFSGEYENRNSFQDVWGTYSAFNQTKRNDFNATLSALNREGVKTAYTSGYLHLDETGNLVVAGDATEAIEHQTDASKENLAKLTDAIRRWEIDNGNNISGLIDVIKKANALRASSGLEYYQEQADQDAAMRRFTEANTRKDLEDTGPVGDLINYLTSGSSAKTTPAAPAAGFLVSGATVAKDIYGIDTGLPEPVTKESQEGKRKAQELDQRYRALLQRYNNEAEEASMGANQNLARKMERLANVADVDEIRNEDFNSEQQAALMAAKQRAVVNAQKQIYDQGMQDLAAIDDEITARLTAGNLKNELKTQYEDIMKWQATTTRKLYDVYSGTLSEDELQRRVDDIAKATERASEQALTQGNTPMEIIEKAEKRAAEGRKDAWTSTHKELVADTTKYNGVQIQAQWDLMENLDDISGKRTELEKKRQNEAYQAVLENYKNTEMAAEINAIKLIDIDQQGYEKRKSLFGDLYDAATTEGTDLEVAKLTAQFDALAKQFGVTTPLAKEFDRSLQDITDRDMEKSIANSTSFEEYFSKRFAFDEGLFDNATVATEKKFQRMYDIVADGATEMGGEIKNSFIDAFSGTLDSWESVWKSMKQTFLKTLASMIWEAKARPITVGLIAGVTGMGKINEAFAGDSQGAALANSVAGMFGGGSGTTYRGGMGSQGGGLFSSLAKLPDKIDEFGKSVLQFGDNVKLTDGLMAAGLGYGIGTMFGGTSGGIGGAMGGAFGNMAGQALASTFGAMAPGIGQVIGTVAGTLIGAAFAGEKVTSKGIEITIGEGGILTAKNYTNYKSAGLFGGGKRTEYTQTDRSTVNYLSNKFEESTNSLIRAFENIGISASASGYTAKADKIDLRQDPEEAIQAWLTKATRNLADYMVSDNNIISSFSALKEYGESSADAVIRLSDALTEFKEAAIDANVSIQNLSGGLRGLDLVSYTAQFTTMLGSAENVQDFFDIVKEFGTYAGGAGLSNIESLSTELKNAFSDIENVYATSGNNTVLSTLKYRRDALTDNVDDMYNRIDEYSNRSTIWGKFIDIDEAGKVIINSVTNAITGAVTDIDTWASGSPKRQKEWDILKSIIEEYTAGVSELANITERISQEQTNPSVHAPAISPTSTTFWTDMDAAMANLTPELAAAWYDAAKLARQIKEIRDAAKDAAESQRELQNEYMQQNLTTAKASKYLGVSYEGILNIAKASQQLNQNDIAGWFSDVTESTGLSGNMLVYNLVPALEKFQYEGETAIDTFNRLGLLLMELTDSAGVTGISLSEISGGLKGVDLAGFSQELVDLFGSSGAVSDAFARFNQYANTETEQKTYAVDYWKNQAQSRIGELADAFPGVDTSNFWDKYKESMKKGLSPAELYQWDYAAIAMQNMSEAAGTAADAIDELAEYLQSIQDKINEFGMTDTQKFLKNLEADKQEMKDNILSKGGTEADLAIVDQYGVAAIQDRIGSIMEGISSSMDSLTGSDYDRKMAEITKTTQENIQALTDLGASEEQLTAVRAYETAQIEELKKAHTDYIQSIQDKIDAFGQDDTDSFLKGVYADAEEMRKQLINTGGAGVDTSIADTYISSAIADRIKDTTDTLKESILDLGMDTFSKQIYDLNTSVAEGIEALEKLGASESDIALIRQEAALKAKEIIKSAAQAYIQAYDDQLTKIEELESERQALQDAVDSARSDYISALQKEIDTKNEAITKLQENVDSLKEFISSLDELKNSLLEDAGFLSSTEKAGLAMANFEKIAAKAAAGDTEARSQLSSAATSAASAAAQGYSYDQYIQTFAKIYGKVNQLQDDAKKQLTPAEQELEAMIASRDALQSILDKLNEEADKTLSIADAEKAYQDAQNALAQSTLDAQIATLQAEANQHKELVEQLRKQYDETVSLSQAAKQYFKTVTALSSFAPETLSAEKLIEQNVAMNNILSQTQEITSKAKKTADRTYDKVDEVLYFMQEDNKKLYKLLGDTYKGSYTYTETVDSVETTKTDVGLKVILSNMQVKDSILSALREANDLTTVPATSVIGLLNGIKNCACECQCNSTSTCDYYGETDDSCSIMDITTYIVTDSSELAADTFDKTFSTIDGAFTATAFKYNSSGVRSMELTSIGSEDPDCTDAFYVIIPDVIIPNV